MTDDFKKKYDDLILAGVRETDPAKRKPIYEQIQLEAQKDAVVIWMYQNNDMMTFQTWIKGYYHNSAYFQNPYTWLYALSKVAP